jgi:hypothetical protein
LPLVPIATFLAGSLLSLLLPVLLLIALVAWYWWFSARVPETADGPEAGAAPAAANPAPAAANPAPAPANPAPSAPPEPNPPAHGV